MEEVDFVPALLGAANFFAPFEQESLHWVTELHRMLHVLILQLVKLSKKSKGNYSDLNLRMMLIVRFCKMGIVISRILVELVVADHYTDDLLHIFNF